MATPAEIADAILQDLAGPERAEVDGVVMQQPKLADRLQALNELTSQSVTIGKRRGLRFNKIVPPGAT